MTLDKRFAVPLTLIAVVSTCVAVGRCAPPAVAAALKTGPQKIRVATFNTSLSRDSPGKLIRDLQTSNDRQAARVAEIIQRVRPDVLCLNELDYDSAAQALELFQARYLEVSQNGQRPIKYPHRFTGPVNTGLPSGLDLDQDGKTNGPGDALGYGDFAGQYGMAVLSRFPIETRAVRTFQKFLWQDMPQALLPVNPATEKSFYTPPQRQVIRLSSKNHWDLPLRVGSRTVHLLACHPTPPAFDGPEDRNGRRNHDEIRLLADYLTPEKSTYIYDDLGRRGGLDHGALFIIAGDLNADPRDGNSTGQAIQQLLEHPLVHRQPVPGSAGGAESARVQQEANLGHQGDPSHDTADFNDAKVGNLRVDYVLTSKKLNVINCGVFWPGSGQAGRDLVGASDHRLVWVDVAWHGG